MHTIFIIVPINSISPERLEELAESTARLFNTHLYIKENYYTRSSSGKSAGGAFQTYYGKQKEKEIAIRRLNYNKNRKKKY